MTARTSKKVASLLVLGFLYVMLGFLSVSAGTIEVDQNKAVIDNANILTDETEEIVTNLSIALSDTCGAQIGVYTIDHVGNTTMEGYAYELFKKWGLGDQDRDNGVLLLLSSEAPAPYQDFLHYRMR